MEVSTKDDRGAELIQAESSGTYPQIKRKHHFGYGRKSTHAGPWEVSRLPNSS